ncbi:MAG: GNAT family N-acetyltransferase [Myxococcota bacterium]
MDGLSRRAFIRYAHRPVRAVRAMVEQGETLVGRRDGQPVGFVVIRIERHPRFGPVSEPLLAHLDAIAVSALRRGRGRGRQLLAAAEAHAATRGALAMFLMTASNNRRARALFAAAGYQPLAGMAAAYRDRHAAVLMTKLLEPSAAVLPMHAS